MSGCRSEAGRLFQILGPATEKLLSPSRVFVLGTVRTLAWAERSWGRPESAISWQSSTRYDGAEWSGKCCKVFQGGRSKIKVIMCTNVWPL